jgi:hypothetical protein
MARLFLFSPLRPPVFLCCQTYIVRFTQCRNVDLIKWRNLVFNQTKNCFYQNCMNKNHHLKNNSGRRRSHQCQMVIRG